MSKAHFCGFHFFLELIILGILQRDYMRVFYRSITTTANQFVTNNLITFYKDSMDETIIFVVIVVFLCCFGTLFVIRMSRMVKN